MIGHGIDLDDGLFFLSDDAHDITVELGFVLFRDEGLSTFNGEDDVYVDLCIGVGHGFPYTGTIFYRDAAPTGLKTGSKTVFYTNAAPTGLKTGSKRLSTQMPPLRG